MDLLGRVVLFEEFNEGNEAAKTIVSLCALRAAKEELPDVLSACGMLRSNAEALRR